MARRDKGMGYGAPSVDIFMPPAANLTPSPFWERGRILSKHERRLTSRLVSYGAGSLVSVMPIMVMPLAESQQICGLVLATVSPRF